MSSTTSELDRVFTALADPNRRDILDKVSRGPRTASELAEPLAMSVTGLLKHLRALEDAKLVTTRKIGRARWCELAPDGLHVETGYPTADICDALLRNGAALGLESFELSVLRRNTQPDGS